MLSQSAAMLSSEAMKNSNEFREFQNFDETADVKASDAAGESPHLKRSVEILLSSAFGSSQELGRSEQID
jgi:hypothetical protein